MADKKPVYNPGELDKVKSRLGPIDDKEAKRMQQVLGGEIGVEKNSAAAAAAKKGAVKRSTDGSVGGSSKPKRTVEIAPAGDTESNGQNSKSSSRTYLPVITAPYVERVKMDTCAAEQEYGIKTPWQLFISKMSFFKQPKDFVSMWFVKDRLNEYYNQFETIVTQTRLMFPRNNLERSTKLKKMSAFSYNVLDVIRKIKIDIIASEMGRVQSHPRQVFVREFLNMVREIYKPIYILENLDTDHHISEAYNVLYKLIYFDNPTTETEKLLKTISECLAAWQYISVKIKRYMYPILMKLLCVEYVPCDTFFNVNEEKICYLLGVSKDQRIVPSDSLSFLSETKKEKENGLASDEENENTDSKNSDSEIEDDLNNVDEISSQSEEERKAQESERIVVDHGLKILEKLFPKAGWNNLATFPDFYPYFSDIIELKKNSELIAPEDPVQLALVLSQTIEELLYGFREIKFSELDDAKPLSSIIDEWHNAVEESFARQYLPRVAEYAHFFEHAGKTSAYISNLVTDLHWIRRYYFIPHYDYRSPTPPTFKKSDVIGLYPIVRHLRKDLTKYAAAIDTANKAGGKVADVPVEGIINPWSNYTFTVENPISRRLNSLLAKNQRTNVSLMFFTLAIITVLDNHLNDPNSLAYNREIKKLFRSSDEEGKTPVLWVEKQTNTMALFRQSLEAGKAK